MENRADPLRRVGEDVQHLSTRAFVSADTACRISHLVTERVDRGLDVPRCRRALALGAG